MATKKKSSTRTKVLAALLTTLGPALAQFVLLTIKSNDAPTLCRPTPILVPGATQPPVDPISPPKAVPEGQTATVGPLVPRTDVDRSDVLTQVIVEGTGKTPDEALHQALHIALKRAIAARVDSATWQGRGALLCDSMVPHAAALIRNWKELSGRCEWTIRGARHHREVAVELDGRAMLGYLRTALSVAAAAPEMNVSPAGAPTPASVPGVQLGFQEIQ